MNSRENSQTTRTDAAQTTAAQGGAIPDIARRLAAAAVAFGLTALAGCSAPWSHSDAASASASPSASPSASQAAATEAADSASPSESSTPETQTYSADVFLAGDYLLHSPVYDDGLQADGTYNFASQMSGLGDISTGYDLKYYNQESILGGTQLGLSTYPCFNSPQEAGDAMVSMGFNLVSTANNHSLDKGEKGIRSSLEYWARQEQEHGVHTAGTYESWNSQRAIPVYEKNGITYTFLSWTYGCNGITPPAGEEYLVNEYPGREQEMLDQVRQAAAESDVTIVAMHWGTEYVFEPTAEQQTLAQELADVGADIIVGNHPHVVEPVQWIGNTICYYAMGNTMSAQDDIDNQVGMVGGVTITKTVTGDQSAVQLSNARADLIYTYHDASYRNYQVIPFDRLDDAHLASHEAVYQKYSQYITQMDPSIGVGGVRKQ